MKLSSESFPFGGRIPSRCAFGQLGPDRRQSVSAENLNPHLSWSEVPEGTQSFVIACLDDDVPTDFSDRDCLGDLLASQMRRRFVHWVQINVPAGLRTIAEGALKDKCALGFGRPGINDYSRGEQVSLGEVGSGYDGPNPPAQDARWHGYRFIVHALDVAELSLPEAFTWQETQKAMQGHVLASAEWVGFYSQNPRLV